MKHQSQKRQCLQGIEYVALALNGSISSSDKFSGYIAFSSIRKKGCISMINLCEFTIKIKSR
jgi:hypothetical protein